MRSTRPPGRVAALLDEVPGSQVDLPTAPGPGRPIARAAGRSRVAPGASSGSDRRQPEGSPSRREAQLGFAHLALEEVAHPPGTAGRGRGRASGGTPRARRRCRRRPRSLHRKASYPGSSLERCRLAEPRRADPALAGQPFGLREGLTAIHPELEVDEGGRPRRSSEGGRRRGHRGEGEQQPEPGFAEHGGHAILGQKPAAPGVRAMARDLDRRLEPGLTSPGPSGATAAPLARRPHPSPSTRERRSPVRRARTPPRMDFLDNPDRSVRFLFDFLLHLDKHLQEIIATYGAGPTPSCSRSSSASRPGPAVMPLPSRATRCSSPPARSPPRC